MKCLASSSMQGVLDVILSPKKSAEDWIADQRRAVAGDISYQRATMVAEARQVASEAIDEAAVKFAITGIVTFAVCALAYRLATRER